MKVEKHKIQNQNEECTCEWCGWPMYEGEIVLYYDETPYCSELCFKKHRQVFKS